MKKIITIAAALSFIAMSGADLYLIGDSTMAQYRPTSAPQAGWGMFVAATGGGKVFNFAVGGKSTKSYRDSGAWAKVMKKVKPGDVMLIQFGANDANKNRPQNFTEPEKEFRSNLERYVKELQAAKVRVILASPVSPLRFNKQKQPYSYLAPYAKVTGEVAAANNVPYIDMTAFGIAENGKAGVDNARKYYMYLAPGEHKNWPKGRKDAVHLNETGAKLYADFFISEVKKRKLPGCELFK